MASDYQAFVEPRLASSEMLRGAAPGDRPAVTRIDLAALQAACTGT